MKRLSKLFLAFVTLSLIGSFGIGSMALAETGSTNDNYSSTSEAAKKAAEVAKEQAKKLSEQKKEAEKKRIEAQKKLEEQKREAAKKLSEVEAKKLKQVKENYLKACESRHQAFKSKLDNINNATKNHINTLNAIDSRVQTFVKNNNLDIPNYDALLLNINTQKQLVQSLQNSSTNDVQLFKCGTSPGDATISLQSYKDNYLQEVNAIKSYKQAIKDLISAVKTAYKSKGGEQ